MKKKFGIALREVCGESFLIAEGYENIDFSKIIALNETSTFLWKSIGPDQSFTEQELVKLLTDEYDVTPEEASKDVHDLVCSMLDAGIIES